MATTGLPRPDGIVAPDSARARHSRCPWSWFRRSVRRRCRSLRPAALIDLRSSCVDRPTIASAPATLRAASTGRSSWPTWTPAAPLSARDVGAVVDDDQRAPLPSATRTSRSASARTSRLESCLHRSCSTRAPPARYARASVSGIAPAGRAHARYRSADRGRVVVGSVGATRPRQAYTASARLPVDGFFSTR